MSEREVFQLTLRERSIYSLAFKTGAKQAHAQLKAVELIPWMIWSNPVREAYYHTLRRFTTPEFMEWGEFKDEA